MLGFLCKPTSLSEVSVISFVNNLNQLPLSVSFLASLSPTAQSLPSGPVSTSSPQVFFAIWSPKYVWVWYKWLQWNSLNVDWVKITPGGGFENAAGLSHSLWELFNPDETQKVRGSKPAVVGVI